MIVGIHPLSLADEVVIIDVIRLLSVTLVHRRSAMSRNTPARDQEKSELHEACLVLTNQ